MRTLKAFVGLHMFGLGLLLSRAFAHGTASEVADKWATNLGNAQTSMTNGVNRVTTPPGQAAAAKRQKWVAAITAPATQDKWARKVAAVPLQTWKDSMTNIGIPRAAQGAQQKKPKFQAAMASLLPFIDQVAAQVRAMPDTTPNDREQRAIAMMRGMRNYQGTSSGQ